MGRFGRCIALSVLGTLGISCYILADTFFVSRGLGANGLAALNIAIPVYNFIHGCGLMLGMGGGTKFTLQRSRGKTQRACETFTHTVLAAIAISILFSGFGLLGAEKLAQILGADGVIRSMSSTYLRWLMAFAPAFIMNDVLLCFVRNDGGAKRAMLAMLGGSFANIVMDYVFIFPFHMGIFGAVLATGFAPLISMSILVPHYLKKGCGFRLMKTAIKGRRLIGIASIGAPSLLAQVSGGVVMIVFNLIMLRIRGNLGVAAYGIIANLALVVTGVYTGIAEGAQPLLSEACGMGNKNELKKLLRYAAVTVLAASCLIYAGLAVFANPVAAIFNSERNIQLQNMATEGIRLYFTSGFFAGLNILLATFFASVERPLPAQVLSLLRGLVLLIPLAFAMTALWELQGLWLAVTVTELLTLALSFLCLKRCSSLSQT